MKDLSIADRLAVYAADLRAIRHDLHAPSRAGLRGTVAPARSWRAELTRLGFQVTTGLRIGPASSARLPVDTGAKALGCAPTWMRCRSQKPRDFLYQSRIAGRMHACGHDGHTAILLGAARYLGRDAQLRRHGPSHLSAGGGEFRRRQAHDRRRAVQALPVRCVFAFHNCRASPAGQFAVKPGTIMAAVDVAAR